MDARERLRAPGDVDGQHLPWWALDELCEQLVRGRHVALRESVSSLRDELAALVRDYGHDVPLLVDASCTVETVHATLLSHLAKEENILFPAFTALAAAWRDGRTAPRLPFPTVRHPISLMAAEHDRLERALAHLRAISAELALPVEATARLHAWRLALHRFDEHVQADTAVEDDVLFPRALELERALL
jgi:regulator of cell morphogenesis and NO signaling